MNFLISTLRIIRETLDDISGIFCHLLFRMFNSASYIWGNIRQQFKMNVASTILALATLGLAITTYFVALETKGLKEADLGPNISFANIQVALRNEGSNRLTQQLVGESVQDFSDLVSENTKNAFLSLQFSNTGKNVGYVKLVNPEAVGTIYCNQQSGRLSHDYHLIPAGEKSGWLYPCDVKAWLLHSRGFRRPISIEYEFEIYNAELALKNRLMVTIKCAAYDDGSDFICKPVRRDWTAEFEEFFKELERQGFNIPRR